MGLRRPRKAAGAQHRGVERPIGEEATNRLRSILAGGELRCATHDQDRYGRTVAQCWAGRVDIGQEMVRSGWAWALPRYSKRLYLPAQEEAERENRGVWAGRGHCEAPARYRQNHRR